MYNRALKGSSPEAEAKGLPFGIVRAAVSFNHSSAAWQVCWAAHGKEKQAACTALRSAAFGSLLRALRSHSLLARACAGPRCRALAVRRRRAGVQRRVAASNMLHRTWCKAVQCGAHVACAVPGVHARWVNRDRTDPSSCVLAETRRKSAVPRHVVCLCALVGAVCHCGHTALQPAHLRARGG